MKVKNWKIIGMEEILPEDDGENKGMVLPGSMWSAPNDVSVSPDVTSRPSNDPTNNSQLLFIAVEYVNGGNIDYENLNTTTFSTDQEFPELEEHLNPLTNHVSPPNDYPPVYTINNEPNIPETSPTHSSFNPNSIVILPNSTDPLPHSNPQSDHEFNINSVENNLELLRHVVTNRLCQPICNSLDMKQENEILITDESGLSYTLNQDDNEELMRNRLMDTQELVLDSIALDDHILMDNGTLVLKPNLEHDLRSVVHQIDLDSSEQPVSDPIDYDLGDIDINIKMEPQPNYLKNEESSQVRRSKRQLVTSTEETDLFSDCPDCLINDLTIVLCANHRPLSISDKPVPSRARATLPANYLYISMIQNNDPKESEETIYGIFAKKAIPKRAQFGPVEGVVMKDPDSDVEFFNDLALILEGESGLMHKMDTSNEDLSNWMRFVRKAETYDEQNLVLSQMGPSLYFFTTCAIAPRQELKVGYSSVYAERRNLPYLTSADVRKEQLPCFECDMTFESKEELEKHLDSHDVDNGLKSVKPKRNKKKSGDSPIWKSSKQDSVDSVDSTGVSSTEKDPLSEKENVEKKSCIKFCKVCHKLFDGFALYEIHMLVHRDLGDESVTSSSDERYACPACDIQFPGKYVLAAHVTDEHQIKPSRPNKCKVCYKVFAEPSRLQSHMACHLSDDTKPIPCDRCGKRFLTNSALQCHKRNKEPFNCAICNESFSDLLSHRLHVKTHCIDGIFKCPQCPKEFKEFSVVRKHIRVFHSGRKFKCEECGKKFYASDKLKAHLLKHSNVREFLCSICGQQFKRKDKLTAHYKYKHANKEPEELEQNLNVMQMIDNTIKIKKFMPKVSPTDYHRFIYKCHTCLVGFKRRGMLVNHLAKRHPDVRPDSVPELNLPILRTTRDYYCQYCDKVYKSSSKRKAHIIKNHPGNPLPPSNRNAEVTDLMGNLNPVSFSQTVGSVTTNPHNCLWCHKQYATKAKLLQHERSKHPGKVKDDKKGGEIIQILSESFVDDDLVSVVGSHHQIKEKESILPDLQGDFLSDADGFGGDLLSLGKNTKNKPQETEELTDVTKETARYRISDNGDSFQIIPMQNEPLPVNDSVLRALLSTTQPTITGGGPMVDRVWSENNEFTSPYIPPR